MSMNLAHAQVNHEFANFCNSFGQSKGKHRSNRMPRDGFFNFSKRVIFQLSIMGIVIDPVSSITCSLNKKKFLIQEMGWSYGIGISYSSLEHCQFFIRQKMHYAHIHTCSSKFFWVTLHQNKIHLKATE